MRSTFLFAVLVSVALAGNGVAAADCNGAQELCSRPYHQIAYAMTHNSYSVGSDTAANQNFDVTTQLNDGIRAVNLDAVQSTNGTGIELCHSSCTLLDAGPATNILQKIVAWLNENPNEVLTIIWENSQGVPISEFQQAYTDSGMIDHAYMKDPVGSQTWPTLSEIISSGKRVINFVGAGADASVAPWLYNEFDYVFETPFENVSPDGFKCVVDRPSTGGDNLGLYVLNHFLDSTLNLGGTAVQYPDRGAAATTNGPSLQQHAQTCSTTFGRIPNFVAVDFYEQGSNNVNVMSVVASLNKLKYDAKPLGDGTSGNVDSSTNANNGNSRHPFFALTTGSMLCSLAILAIMGL